MTRLLDEVHLSKRAVRGLGITLVTVGLSIPIGAVVFHAASWQPNAVERGSKGPFRPELVILPSGTFRMGSANDEPGREDNETLHTVTISQRFALSLTEITQGQYFAVMGERPVEERTDVFGRSCSEAGVGDDLPVVCIDWWEAIRFCNELSKREGLEPAYTINGLDVAWDSGAPGYRLPTEAEWEYAARADTRHRYAGTDDESAVCDYANVADLAGDEKYSFFVAFECYDGYEALAPVASKLPNRWLLYDMTGNVWEWVWDGWDGRTPYPAASVTDPRGQAFASNRVYRGGSRRYYPLSPRVAFRNWGDPSHRFDYLGFRVARSLPSIP